MYSSGYNYTLNAFVVVVEVTTLPVKSKLLHVVYVYMYNFARVYVFVVAVVNYSPHFVHTCKGRNVNPELLWIVQPYCGKLVYKFTPEVIVYTVIRRVSRQLVYGHFVYDTSSTDISSTDISSTMTFLAKIKAGVMKRIIYQ